MMYEAIIKVPVSATNDEKVSQIRMGIFEVAARLTTEYGQDPDDVREWFEQAADEAEGAAEDERAAE